MNDPSGVYGSVMSYAMTVFFAAGAFMIFIYLWVKGRLDLDEDAKDQMMKQREREEFNE